MQKRTNIARTKSKPRFLPRVKPNFSTRKRGKSSECSLSKADNSQSVFKKQFSSLKCQIHIQDEDLRAYLDILELLFIHIEKYCDDINYDYLNNLTVNQLLAYCFRELKAVTNFYSFYWFEESKTLRLFKKLNGFDNYSVWVIRIGSFFDNKDSFSNNVQELIFSFIKSWFAYSFFSDDFGISDWFFETELDHLDYYKKTNVAESVKIIEPYLEKLIKAKEELNKIGSNNNSLSNLLLNFEPQNSFEKTLKLLLQKYNQIDLATIFNTLNYTDIEDSVLEDYFEENITQINIYERNLDKFHMLFLMSYYDDDRFTSFHIQWINDSSQEENMIDSLYNYMDINMNNYGSFQNMDLRELHNLISFINEFNTLFEQLNISK